MSRGKKETRGIVIGLGKLLKRLFKITSFAENDCEECND